LRFNPTQHSQALAAIVIVVSSALLQVMPGAVELLRFQHDALATGEIWRLVTGHWVHLNMMHLVLNAAGAALIALLFAEELMPIDWLAAVTFMALFSSGALLLRNPNVEWYVGLSGVLHGLMLTGALLLWHSHKTLATLICIVVIAKLAHEQWAGGEPATAKLINGTIVVDAHLYGAIAGVIWGTLRLALHRFLPHSTA